MLTSQQRPVARGRVCAGDTPNLAPLARDAVPVSRTRPVVGRDLEMRLAGSSEMRETLRAMDQIVPEGKLPTAFHGYARDPVDKLLAEIEESYRALIAERDELREKLEAESKRQGDLTAELEKRTRQERVIADAVIEAERLKAEADRQTSELKAAATRDAAETRERAEHEAQELRAAAERDAEAAKERAASEADELLQAAQAHADRLVTEMEKRLGQRQRRAEELLEDVGARLGSLVRDLFDQAGTAAQGRGAAHESEQGAR